MSEAVVPATISKDFVVAGKATFTLELNPQYAMEESLRPHYTFRVRLKPANGEFGDTYFVQLLTGPDNTSNYQYLGILNPENGQIRCTQKSVIRQDELPVRLLNRALELVWNDQSNVFMEKGFSLHHEGKCGKCGRKLTVPESITSGFGPECRKS